MYELIKVGEHTYYIDCPSIIGIYKYNENDVCLIDSGSDISAGKKVLRAVNDKNWNVKMIFNTHSHADHLGGNKYIQDRTGCKIYYRGVDISFIQNTILQASFISNSYPLEPLKHKFFLAQPSNAEPATNDTLPPGLEMIELDGHAFSMTGFRTCDNIYFIADAVSSEAAIKKYQITFLYDIEKHLNTLDKICNLDGNIYIPSHVGQIKDIASLVKINKEKIFEIMDLIKEILINPHTLEDLLQTVFNHYNLIMDIKQYALIKSTVTSYLAYMHRHEIIDYFLENNKLFWKTI